MINWWNSLDQTIQSLILSGFILPTLYWYFTQRKKPPTNEENIKNLSEAAAAQSKSAADQSQAAAETVTSILATLKYATEENEKRISALEKALDMKNNYIEALEREIEVMKSYLKKLIKYLKDNDVNFPEPPDGLLDTEPKIKGIKRK